MLDEAVPFGLGIGTGARVPDDHLPSAASAPERPPELTSDDDLLRIAELPEVPVSLENCRQLDPQTRVVMVCRLDVSPAETPRWRRIPLAGIPAWPRGEPRILDTCRGARIEERTLPGGGSLLRAGPAADLPA